MIQPVASKVLMARALRKFSKNAIENTPDRRLSIAGIQKIIRNSHTEFDKGAEEYRVYRETHDAPDWGVVRMSSIAMAQQRTETAELFLKQQMEEYGGAKRQARNVDVSAEQVVASIERILRKAETSDAAFQFFDFLRKYKFCTTRDVFVRVLIEHTASKEGWKKAFERLQSILKDDKRAKNMTMSIYFILENASRAGELEQAEKLLSELESVKPSTLLTAKLFLRFNEWKQFEVLDYCQKNVIKFSHESVLTIIEMAGKLKYPTVLLRILEVQQLTKSIIPKTIIYPVFDELTKLAGKSGNPEELCKVIWMLKIDRGLSDPEKYILYGKLRHFYKCLNVKEPTELPFLVKLLESH